MSERRCRIGSDVVRAELCRVLGSPGFDASERNRRFLSYVVEETLAGRGERLKAYNIATEVFGRDSSFDPVLDSIVRIEASRLRRSLERYYLTDGTTDTVRITIPKGSYVPVFEPVERRVTGPADEAALSIPSAAPHHVLIRHGHAICVQPFEEEGDHSVFPNFNRGLTRQIIVGLTRFTNLHVFSGESAPDPFGGFHNALTEAASRVDFLLTGGTTLAGGRFSVEVLLRDARNGRYLWGERFERSLNPTEILAVRDDVANSVVRSLAQPYGVIFCARETEMDGVPPDSLAAFDAVTSYFQYRRQFEPELFEAVRASLEEAILAEPSYAEAYACLSLIYSDAHRFGITVPGQNPRRRALSLARQALELAPQSSHGYHALALAYWFDGDPRAGLEALETAWALNPNDTNIMAELGLRYATQAEWQKAVPLIEESYARNPAQPGRYRCGLVLYHYAHGRYQEAFIEARRIGTPRHFFGTLFLAIAAARLGLRQEAEDAVRAMLKIDPRYGEHVTADLQARHTHPDLVRLIVDGLRKAGLSITDTASTETGRSASASHRLFLASVR